MQNLNELAKEVHAGNVERGFYEVQPTLKTQLMLVITELSEAVESDRKGRYARVERYNEGIDIFTSCPNYFINTPYPKEEFEKYIKDTFEDEIADAFIRLLDIAGNYDAYIQSALSGFFVNDNKIDDIFVMTYRICLISKHEEQFFRLLNESIYSIIEYCSKYKIDLNFHVTEKLKYNSTRPYKHGKNY